MKTDIYTLAHEVKNPLCVVKGYLEMLNKDNLAKYKPIIEEELANSLSILDNYLEYRKLMVNLEVIDINLLLLDIQNSWQDYLKKHHVNLKVNFIDDEIYIMGDYYKLKQVFNNIIKNAQESFAKNITINYWASDNKLIVQVKNDGISLEEDEPEKIGTNYSGKVLGNGIGVNLSKKIIKLHHGDLCYKNNSNKGISAYITLLIG